MLALVTLRPAAIGPIERAGIRETLEGVARVLFAMFEGGGNIPLITPVVGAVVERGHDVTVVAGPNIRRANPGLPSESFLDRLRATGARVVPLLDSPIDPLDGFVLGSVVFGWTPSSLFGAVDVGRTARWSQPWADHFSSQLASVRPDVVVADYFLLGALAAAEHAGVPTAALVHTSSIGWPLPGVPLPPPGSLPARGPLGRVRDHAWAAVHRHISRRDGLRSLNAARAGLGLAPLDVPHQQIERADRVLVLASRAFELPARSLPDNVRYVGTILAPAPASDWEPPPGDGRPLVLVSLSTLPQGQGPIMQRILDALRGLPVRAVVTLGRSLAGESFDAPDNVQLETFVPHEVVLPHVAAVVTQCGFSTITKSLARGVPLVAIPVLGDQPANAARITALGVGIRLGRDAAAPAIADAIHRIVDETSYRQAAQRFAVTLAAEDPRAAVIDELEDLTGDR